MRLGPARLARADRPAPAAQINARRALEHLTTAVDAAWWWRVPPVTVARWWAQHHQDTPP